MDREIYSKVKREYEIKHDLKLRQAREFETKILNENKSLFKVKKDNAEQFARMIGSGKIADSYITLQMIKELEKWLKVMN